MLRSRERMGDCLQKGLSRVKLRTRDLWIYIWETRWSAMSVVIRVCHAEVCGVAVHRWYVARLLLVWAVICGVPAVLWGAANHRRWVARWFSETRAENVKAF